MPNPEQYLAAVRRALGDKGNSAAHIAMVVKSELPEYEGFKDDEIVQELSARYPRAMANVVQDVGVATDRERWINRGKSFVSSMASVATGIPKTLGTIQALVTNDDPRQTTLYKMGEEMQKPAENMIGRAMGMGGIGDAEPMPQLRESFVDTTLPAGFGNILPQIAMGWGARALRSIPYIGAAAKAAMPAVIASTSVPEGVEKLADVDASQFAKNAGALGYGGITALTEKALGKVGGTGAATVTENIINRAMSIGTGRGFIPAVRTTLKEMTLGGLGEAVQEYSENRLQELTSKAIGSDAPVRMGDFSGAMAGFITAGAASGAHVAPAIWNHNRTIADKVDAYAQLSKLRGNNDHALYARNLLDTRNVTGSANFMGGLAKNSGISDITIQEAEEIAKTNPMVKARLPIMKALSDTMSKVNGKNVEFYIGQGVDPGRYDIHTGTLHIRLDSDSEDVSSGHDPIQSFFAHEFFHAMDDTGKNDFISALGNDELFSQSKQYLMDMSRHSGLSKEEYEALYPALASAKDMQQLKDAVSLFVKEHPGNKILNQYTNQDKLNEEGAARYIEENFYRTGLATDKVFNSNPGTMRLAIDSFRRRMRKRGYGGEALNRMMAIYEAPYNVAMSANKPAPITQQAVPHVGAPATAPSATSVPPAFDPKTDADVQKYKNDIVAKFDAYNWEGMSSTELEKAWNTLDKLSRGVPESGRVMPILSNHMSAIRKALGMDKSREPAIYEEIFGAMRDSVWAHREKKLKEEAAVSSANQALSSGVNPVISQNTAPAVAKIPTDPLQAPEVISYTESIEHELDASNLDSLDEKGLQRIAEGLRSILSGSRPSRQSNLFMSGRWSSMQKALGKDLFSNPDVRNHILMPILKRVTDMQAKKKADIEAEKGDVPLDVNEVIGADLTEAQRRNLFKSMPWESIARSPKNRLSIAGEEQYYTEVLGNLTERDYQQLHHKFLPRLYDLFLGVKRLTKGDKGTLSKQAHAKRWNELMETWLSQPGLALRAFLIGNVLNGGSNKAGVPFLLAGEKKYIRDFSGELSDTVQRSYVGDRVFDNTVEFGREAINKFLAGFPTETSFSLISTALSEMYTDSSGQFHEQTRDHYTNAVKNAIEEVTIDMVTDDDRAYLKHKYPEITGIDKNSELARMVNTDEGKALLDDIIYSIRSIADDESRNDYLNQLGLHESEPALITDEEIDERIEYEATHDQFGNLISDADESLLDNEPLDTEAVLNELFPEKYAVASNKDKRYFRREGRGKYTIPWKLFADSDEKILSYGNIKLTADDIDATHVLDIYDDIVDAVSSYDQDLSLTVDDINPPNIVNSAGVWDDAELTQKIYEDILSPRGIEKVVTNDGMVVFNTDLISREDGSKYAVSSRGNRDQEFTSRGTSRPQIPAIFKKIRWVKGSVNADLGGGKYDLGSNYLSSIHGVRNIVIDKYNRDIDHNAKAELYLENNPADTGTLTNVLNVIKESDIRIGLLEQLSRMVKDGGKIYVSVYNSGKEGQSGRDSWQNALNIKEYVPEIESVFGNNYVLRGDMAVIDNVRTKHAVSSRGNKGWKPKTLEKKAIGTDIPKAIPMPRHQLEHMPSGFEKLSERHQAAIIGVFEAGNNYFEEARRFRQPVNRTLLLSNQLDFTSNLPSQTPSGHLEAKNAVEAYVEAAKKKGWFQHGRAMNAIQLPAWERVVEGLTSEGMDLEEQLKRHAEGGYTLPPGMTSEMMGLELENSYIRNRSQLRAALEIFMSGQSEAGRALQILGAIKWEFIRREVKNKWQQNKYIQKLKELNALYAAAHGLGSIQALWMNNQHLPPAQRLIAVNAQLQPKGWDRVASMATWYMYNNMLSGLPTHVRNGLGTAMNLVVNEINNPIASGLARMMGSDAFKAGEGDLASVSGALKEGFLEGLKDFIPIMVDGVGKLNIDMVDIPHELHLYNKPKYSRYFNGVRRLMSATENIFASAAVKAETHRLAWGQAAEQFTPGTQQFTALYNTIKNDPHDIVTGLTAKNMTSLNEYMKRVLFRRDSGRFTKAVMRAISEVDDPVSSRIYSTLTPLMQKLFPSYGFEFTKGQKYQSLPIARNILPFIRTMGDISRSAWVEYSPIGMLRLLANDKADWGREDFRRLGASVTGTAFGAFIMMLFEAGLIDITGAGPGDKDRSPEKAAIRETRPINSIRFGNTWYSHNLMPMFTGVLSMIGNYNDMAHEKDPGSIAEFLGRLGNTFLSQSTIYGLSQSFNAIKDVDGWSAQRAFSTMAKSWVPMSGAQQWITSARSTGAPNAGSFVSMMLASNPFFAEQLPKRVETSGRNVSTGIFGMSDIKEAVDDPVQNELARLRKSTNGDPFLDLEKVSLFSYKPPRAITNLNDWQTAEVNRGRAMLSNQIIWQVMTSSAYAAMNDRQRAFAVHAAISAANSQGADLMNAVRKSPPEAGQALINQGGPLEYFGRAMQLRDGPPGVSPIVRWAVPQPPPWDEKYKRAAEADPEIF